MSRLDSFIRRLQAQRACIDWAAADIAGRPGCVLEFGLGNGRTYDHLRERLPAREIYVFDRRVSSHLASTPPAERLILGDLFDTLPTVSLPERVALVHSDVGSGDAEGNRTLAALLGMALPRLLAPGAVILCDQEIGQPDWQRLPEPPDVPAERYFLYRAP